MAPLEPHAKVLVDRGFLETTHGALDCTGCHGGDAGAMEMQAAHTGMTADPTFPDAEQACGSCHDETVARSKTSLHFTLATYRPMMQERAATEPAKRMQLDRGMENHCSECHASCGECHVSRPNFAKGGFIDGHQFRKTPDQTNQCTACHGSRVGSEFTGETGQGDVHYTKHNMNCMGCHSAKDLHGDGRSDHRDRYDVEGLARCEDCHKLDSGVEQHAIHGDKVACHVCHAQPYANCYSCHVGLDQKGLAYYKNPVEKELLRIGRNPRPDAKRPYRWVVLRRVPAVADAFRFYGDGLLERFDRLPTWKYASPHNIQRFTAQNRACNNCHGNEELFLTEDKVEPTLVEANQAVIVPRDQIPARQAATPVPEKKAPKRSYF